MTDDHSIIRSTACRPCPLSANCEVCKLRMHDDIHLCEVYDESGIGKRASIRCPVHCLVCGQKE